LYNDAGDDLCVEAVEPSMSDEEFEYVFNVAEALGCTRRWN
jgi:hypothetical protein